MMQELETEGAPELSTRGTVTGHSFGILFALAGSDHQMDARSLGFRLGMRETECREILEGLHRKYLVDFVSRLDGQSVSETLRLTDEGEVVLLQSLESMCELPEAR